MTGARYPATPLDVFLIVAALALLVPAGVVAIRSQRRCVACGERYPTAADRARHERIAHQL